MSTSMIITCPECKAKIKITSEMAGKKIRCSNCQAILTIKLPAKAPAAEPPKPKPAAAAATIPVADDPPANPADDDDANSRVAYALAEQKLTPRCPRCAQEMQSEDQVICLHCGYNTRTRTKVATKKVIEHTVQDYIIHLAPAIGCVLVLIGFLVLDILCIQKMHIWLKGSFLHDGEENGKDKWIIKPGMFTLYIILGTVFIGYPLARFAFRRLFIYYTPPEKLLRD